MAGRLPPGCDSIRGTARQLGCTHPALIAAIDDGRIPASAVLLSEDGRRIGLHVDQVRAAMAANTDPVQSARRGLAWTAPASSGEPTAAAQQDDSRSATPMLPFAAPPSVPPSSGESDADRPDGSFHDARADRERAEAALRQLELAKQLGQVVLADDVTRAAHTAARAARDALLSIPDRVAGLVAAETDVARVHAILTNELRQALNGLADRLPALAG